MSEEREKSLLYYIFRIVSGESESKYIAQQPVLQLVEKRNNFNLNLRRLRGMRSAGHRRQVDAYRRVVIVSRHHSLYQ